MPPMSLSRSRFLAFAAAVRLAVSAGAAHGHGEVQEALAAVSRQIEASPAKPGLYLLRGRLHAAHADWPAALADCDRAAALDPALAAVELARGEAWSGAGRLDEADAAFTRYLARRPGGTAAYAARARLRVKAGRASEAAADFALAIAGTREPEPALFIEQAQALAGAGREDDAVRALDSGIARLGPLVTLVLPAIDLDRAAGRSVAALGRIDLMVAAAPRKERWLLLRGEVLAAAGRMAEAHAALEAARAALASLPEERRGSAAAGLLEKIGAAVTRLPEAKK